MTTIRVRRYTHRGLTGPAVHIDASRPPPPAAIACVLADVACDFWDHAVLLHRYATELEADARELEAAAILRTLAAQGMPTLSVKDMRARIKRLRRRQ
mgnify:CR=1 FL=1